MPRSCAPRRGRPAKGLDGPRQMLGQGDRDVIGGADGQGLDGLVHRKRAPGRQAELRRRLAGGARRDDDPVLQRQPPRLQRLEHHIEGHDLGDRCRITRLAGLAREQEFARSRIENNRRITLRGLGARATGSAQRRRGQPQGRPPVRRRRRNLDGSSELLKGATGSWSRKVTDAGRGRDTSPRLTDHSVGVPARRPPGRNRPPAADRTTR